MALPELPSQGMQGLALTPCECVAGLTTLRFKTRVTDTVTIRRNSLPPNARDWPREPTLQAACPE